jgi:hypothetical protein
MMTLFTAMVLAVLVIAASALLFVGIYGFIALVDYVDMRFGAAATTVMLIATAFCILTAMFCLIL